MRLFLGCLFCLSLTITTAHAQWQKINLSDKITKEEKTVRNFTAIEASSDFEVFVTFGKKEALTIEANENLHPHIRVELVDNTLKIGIKDKISTQGKEQLRAYISAKDIDRLSGRGDVVFELENQLKADRLTINLRGDSELYGDLDVNDLKVSLRGDSVLEVEGSADNLTLNAQGDSILKNYRLAVNEAAIDLSGDSVAKITLNGKAEVKASGGSDFYYRGKGSIQRQKLSGDSTIKEKG